MTLFFQSLTRYPHTMTFQRKVSIFAVSKTLFGLAEELGSSTTIAQAMAFVAITLSGADGIDQGELTRQIGVSQSAGIRAVRSLSVTDWTANHNSGKFKDGLGLITVRTDNQDMRRRILALTEQGKDVARRLGLM